MTQGFILFLLCPRRLSVGSALVARRSALPQRKEAGPGSMTWEKDELLGSLTRPSLLNIFFPASLDEKPFCFCEVRLSIGVPPGVPHTSRTEYAYGLPLRVVVHSSTRSLCFRTWCAIQNTGIACAMFRPPFCLQLRHRNTVPECFRCQSSVGRSLVIVAVVDVDGQSLQTVPPISDKAFCTKPCWSSPYT